MNINVKLLADICELPGAPGHESEIRKFILKQLESLSVETSVDNLGNITALKKGKSTQKVMACAHMDEIGFMVTHIDDGGFLRFTTLGGFDPKTLTAQRVIVHGKKNLIGVMGSKPIHVMTAEEKQKPPKISDYFIDMGMPGKEVEKYVEVGNPVTRERQLIEMGDCVNCKSIDNRVSVFILLETLHKLEKKAIPYNFYAVFTVQEEVGIRGANVASLQIQPNFGFGIDTTIAFDVPDAKPHEQVTQLGKGAAIKIMDSSTICDYRMVKYMKTIAKNNSIAWQPEVLAAGGTDTAGIQRMSAGGAIAGAVSIPTRHIHQVIEMANKKDIDAAINLLTTCISNLDTYDWKHN